MNNNHCIFGGIAVIALIDKLIPDGKNPHEVKKLREWK